jgi:serine/threonine protein kinase
MFNKMKTDKQVTLFTELANGTLKEFFESSPNVHQTKSALFQILAGLHTIQMNGQIMHFDIKAQNILYYNVIPGGYWKYVIHDKVFYVPNYGKLFVINDFGISRPLSPHLKITYSKHEHFKLGSRYGIIVNNKLTPIEMHSDNVIYWSDNNMVSNCDQFFMTTSGDTILKHSPIKLTKDQETCLKGLIVLCSS